MTVPRRPHRAEGLRTVELDGETVVYDVAADRLHLLDRNATLVWSLLDGRPLDDVATQLALAFGVDPGVMLADVTGVVGTMREAGLLVAADCG